MGIGGGIMEGIRRRLWGRGGGRKGQSPKT